MSETTAERAAAAPADASAGLSRAVMFRAHGGPDVLECVPVPLPEPRRGEARIRVRACGVNRLDLDIRAGLSRFPHPLPLVLGREAVGVVEALAPDVEGHAVGDRVVVLPTAGCGSCASCHVGDFRRCARRFVPGISHHGGYADTILAPVSALLPLPRAVSFVDAAAAAIAFGTAWHMLVSLAHVRPGEVVLVTGAAGGVGSAAVQVASLCSARVIAAAGSAEKLARAREAGADVCIDYRTESLVEAVSEATAGRGADVVAETVGGSVFADALTCAAVGGRVVTAGAHAGEVVSLDLVDFFRRELRLLGSRAQTASEIETVLDLVAAGKLRPNVDRVLPLDQAAAAHVALASRATAGKLVLQP